ncbi:hypothetical protein Ciccas_011831 [Cichlidogyrus casuarinus]|uniref:Uncharacterized protein n=1 Tax=Cichlidogyrus casuarinus TaxID=1844966 RepID=A0ABD2PQ36_9PLAT
MDTFPLTKDDLTSLVESAGTYADLSQWVVQGSSSDAMKGLFFVLPQHFVKSTIADYNSGAKKIKDIPKTLEAIEELGNTYKEKDVPDGVALGAYGVAAEYFLAVLASNDFNKHDAMRLLEKIKEAFTGKYKEDYSKDDVKLMHSIFVDGNIDYVGKWHGKLRKQFEKWNNPEVKDEMKTHVTQKHVYLVLYFLIAACINRPVFTEKSTWSCVVKKVKDFFTKIE